MNHIDTAAFYFSPLRSANELINRALAPVPGRPRHHHQGRAGPRPVGRVAAPGPAGAAARPGRGEPAPARPRPPRRGEPAPARPRLDRRALRRAGRPARRRADPAPRPVQRPRRTTSPRRRPSPRWSACRTVRRRTSAGSTTTCSCVPAASRASRSCRSSRSPASGARPARPRARAATRYSPWPARTAPRAAQVRLAWTLHRGPHVLAIPGTGDPDHLVDNVAAGALRLTDEDVAALTRRPDRRGEAQRVPDAQRAQRRAERRRHLPRGHEHRVGDGDRPAAALDRAAAGGEHVADPVAAGAVRQRDQQPVAGPEHHDRRAVDAALTAGRGGGPPRPASGVGPRPGRPRGSRTGG